MQFIQPYMFVPMPKIIFGRGMRSELTKIVLSYGKCVLLVIGSTSFKGSSFYEELLRHLKSAHCEVKISAVDGEPSVSIVDDTVKMARNSNWMPDVVVAIGGGSVLDAGKAISAMLMETGSVRDYLEGMEKRQPTGAKIPFIAIPTTSGTGSEATKNAVISEIGENGFKRSLRHDQYVPDIALLDAELMLTVPRGVTAACGLDALTQLIEGFVSTKSSPMTDALAWSGLEFFKRGFERVLDAGDGDVDSRADVAYASLMSGIVLANAGLGVVHGFASPIGAYYHAPHGAVCAALLPDCTRANVRVLLAGVDKKEERGTDVEAISAALIALEKYARIGRLLGDCPHANSVEACEALCSYLEGLNKKYKLPRLNHYGLNRSHFDKILAATNVKNGPVQLERSTLLEILKKQL